MAQFSFLTKCCATLLMVYILVTTSTALSLARVNEKGLNDFCETEIFQATCKAGEVIIMNTARYGRMKFGRCVIKDWGYLGCSKDVMLLADQWCSGRRSCQIPIPNSAFKTALYSKNKCPEDLKSYFEATFRCVKVETADSQSCVSSAYILPSSAPSGILANYVTMETNKGSKSCPWIIQAKQGQRVNITLYDFARTEENDFSPGTDYSLCHVYAILREEKMGERKEQSVCGGGTEREKTVYVTEGHAVEITVISYRSAEDLKYFLIKYEVSGCEDPEEYPNTYMQRLDHDFVRIGCTFSNEMWHLKCVNNKWEGTVGNCSTDVTQSSSDPAGFVQLLLGMFHLPHDYAVVVVVVIAVFIGILIVVLGICCIKPLCVKKKVNKCARKIRSQKNKDKPVQAVHPRTKDSVPNTDSSELLIDTRSNTDHDLQSGNLPPPPAFLMADAPAKEKGQQSEELSEMPPPPPSPSATRKLPTLPGEQQEQHHHHQQLPPTVIPDCAPPPYSPPPDLIANRSHHNFQNNYKSLDRQHLQQFHNSNNFSNNAPCFNTLDSSSKKKLGHRRMPSDVCVNIEKSPRHTSPYRTHSPKSAGYNYTNPHSSFEFPPPPPEVLRQLSEPGQEKQHRVRFQDVPPSKYQGLTHNIRDPLNPLHRHHKASPTHLNQKTKQNYGSFSRRILNARPPTEATVTLDGEPKRKGDEQTYFELEPEPTVPYEYGYSVKTGQKFKVYHGNGQGGKNGERKKIFDKSSGLPSSGTKKHRVITNSTV